MHLTCVFSVVYCPCVESDPKGTTTDVTVAGCLMSRSWRSLLEVTTKSMSRSRRTCFRLGCGLPHWAVCSLGRYAGARDGGDVLRGGLRHGHGRPWQDCVLVPAVRPPVQELQQPQAPHQAARPHSGVLPLQAVQPQVRPQGHSQVAPQAGSRDHQHSHRHL
uniref:Uncharacterized protein n=1 Tax=Ixodes ricinus TaxID=34613 RepID=A0A6B0UYS4_IXORI